MLTKNRAILGDRFKIDLKDLSDKIFANSRRTIYDEHDIFLKAYSINNRVANLDDVDDPDRQNL